MEAHGSGQAHRLVSTWTLNSQPQIQKFMCQVCPFLFCVLDLTKRKPDPEESLRVTVLTVSLLLCLLCVVYWEYWMDLEVLPFFPNNFKCQINGTEKKTVSEKFKTCSLNMSYFLIIDVP